MLDITTDRFRMEIVAGRREIGKRWIEMEPEDLLR
jgi:hypothetical protein